ncbi:hypothetical protein HS088_TW13G01289 [Tripterygium wilfordii]|uniref:Uncharacterized protein n=1 Tax=Tripterygium wilfordii TaxID=458696 RepID=A0A7J7CWC6_TRIWF|nr:hypothetical protein HS088_TW13G01289 [Tripterygium wilfordii]
MFDYLESHALISDDTGYQIRKSCDFSPEAVKQPSQCTKAVEEAFKNTNFFDLYNIYAPNCFNQSVTAKPKPGSQCMLMSPNSPMTGSSATRISVEFGKIDHPPCFRF